MKKRFKRIWSREYGVQYSECAMRALGPEAGKHLPVLMPDTLLIPEQGNEVFCISEDDFDKAMEKIKMMTNAKDLGKIAASFHRYGKRYVKFSKSINNKKLERMGDRKLAEFYLQYCKVWDEYTAFLWMIYYLAEFYSEKGQELVKNIKTKINQADAEVLFSPSERAGILKLKDVLAKLKKKGVKKLSKNDLKKILKQYAWIPCLDYINEPWRENDLEDFYEHLEISGDRMDFSKVTERIGLDEKRKDFFRQIKEIAYLKDQRDVYRRLGIYHSFKLFDEIAKRLNINRKEAVYLTSREIVDCLHGGDIDANEVRKRMNGFLLYKDGDNIKVSSDTEFIDKFVKENISHDEKQEEIKGTIANKGVARGIVKNIISVKELGKVHKGDILISITTHPDFIVAMQKASAFVTDEGGIMSHAAIVSREMNKPCIVGTKIATRTLEDGDLVEVDANNGIVKVLKRA